jgi:hypothetical protein
MTSWRLVASLAVTVLPANFVVAALPMSESRRAAQSEPFRSLRLLDDRLTLLSNQQAALKAALGTGHVNSPASGVASGSVTTILSHMNSTTSGIDHIASELESLYQNQRQPFGVRLFKILRSRAQAIQRDIRSVRRARIARDTNLTESSLEKDVVALIVQFQAISGGSVGTHCRPRTHICCQPKRSQDLLPGEQVACKWVCVQSPKSCRGVLGPRIPQSSSQSHLYVH